MTGGLHDVPGICEATCKWFKGSCCLDMGTEETPILTEESVEAWLDDHKDFTNDYFKRKASQSVVNSWLGDRVLRMATLSADTDSSDHGNVSPTPSSSSTGSRTPRRKISVEEINPRFLPLKPMVNKHEDGTPMFYKSIDTQPSVVSRRASAKRRIDERRTRRLSQNRSPAEMGLHTIDERELIMDLIKDISMELDITAVSHKILQNVSILLDAEICSLFLVREKDNKKYLVSHLFDVSKDSRIEDTIVRNSNEITLEFGQGIAGKVAETGETLNIPDAYKDDRFNQEVDSHTGYKTCNILCMPLYDGNKKIVGVAQAINKHRFDDEKIPFTARDERVFESYLCFSGIAVHNAQLFEKSQIENRRNELLLDLTKILFEEQTSLATVMTTILQHVSSLMTCERTSIMLLGNKENGDGEEDLVFTETYDHYDDKDEDAPQHIKVPFNLDITTQVCKTGEIIRINDASKETRFKFTEDEQLGFTTRNLLCMPIRGSNNQVIGVLQLINKKSEKEFEFTQSDLQLLEAFTIFCGLGICQAQLYEEKSLLLAKQNVLLEVLSYHAVCSEKEAQVIVKQKLHSAKHFNVNSFRFDDSLLDDDGTIKACVRMFTDLNLLEKFRINCQVLCRWLCTVKKNYRPVKYHNWRHAFNVCQTMYCMIKKGGVDKCFTEYHKLALLIACLGHDLDHRGTNNAFQSKTHHPLARLYSTSTLEQHHFNQCLMLLQSEGCCVLESLSAQEYSNVITYIRHAIISTDLAMYFKNRNKYFELVKDGTADWANNKEHLNLLMNVLMTGCDINAITKPWEVQQKVANLVAEEFFQQGDIEKEKLNETPSDMMNRNMVHKLPEMQVGFIDSICMPLYQALAKTSPGLQPLLDGCSENRKNWKNLQNK